MFKTILVSTIVLLILVTFIVLYIVEFYRKKNLYLKEKTMMESDFQKTLLQTQLEIQEQTLKNISQEIHDNIGQALSLAKLNLNTMQAPGDAVLQQKILNSKELVSKAIVDLRDLSRSLDTDYVQEMGLQRAIEYELDMIRRTGTMQTQINIYGNPIRIDKHKELIIFRIVQESINNVIKHANAKNIEVAINYHPTSFELHIADDGHGLPESHTTGLGIRNMHSRAKLIGAHFSMNSTPGKGTEVKIVLPKENENHGNRKD
jgi:two-component system, NarL family, sensor kinase